MGDGAGLRGARFVNQFEQRGPVPPLQMCPLRRTHDSTRPNGCESTRPLGCGKRLQMEHSALVLNSDLQSGVQRVASSLLQWAASGIRACASLTCSCGWIEQFPSDFNGWSELLVKYLSYVEEISPFKVGQIQKLLSDVSKDA